MLSIFTQLDCKSTYFCETGKIFFAGWNIIRTFAFVKHKQYYMT